jgi:hypothetical protein
MSAATYSPAEAFAEAERVYMEPLVRDLRLQTVLRHASLPNWIAQDWSAGSVIVRLEYERGLIACSVASVVEPDRFWAVETVAELFPRIRLMPGGFQRLSLREQADFLLNHLQELQQLFTRDHYPSTRDRLQRVRT